MRILVQLQFLALALLSLSVSANSKESELKVVTSFTILEDLVRELGGSHVEIINLVPRDSDAHMYQPVPSDSIAIANADLVIFNGLGFEGWIDRLLDEVRDETYYLVASEGVSVLRRFGEVDPHAWQSFKNIEIYVNNITNMLIKMMPENKEELIDRRIAYLRSTRDLERNIAIDNSIFQLRNLTFNRFNVSIAIGPGNGYDSIPEDELLNKTLSAMNTYPDWTVGCKTVRSNQ